MHQFKNMMKFLFKKKDRAISSPPSPGAPSNKLKKFRSKSKALPSPSVEPDQRAVIDSINKQKSGDSSSSGSAKSLFSKYIPLPGIGEKEKSLVEKRRKLMRRGTYTVLNPVFVKRPPSPKEKERHSVECHGKRPKPNIKNQRISFKEKIKELRKNAKNIEEASGGAFWVDM